MKKEKTREHCDFFSGVKQYMTNFENLGLSKPLLKAIKQEGFDEPTDIQRIAIPKVLEGKDVLAGSATGSGKTLAFASAIIENSTQGKGIQAIVQTPTRELAQQVAQATRNFSQHKNLTVTSIYGGEDIQPQIQELQKSDVIVGTPGRTLDHLRRGTMDLSGVEIIVLDEADRMLDMGFRDDVEQIMSKCPQYSQKLMFSATVTPELRTIAEKHLRDFVELQGDALVDPEKLTQVYYDVDENKKFSLLYHLLEEEDSDLVLVFCNTRKTTDFIAKNLQKNGIEAQPMHGGYSQNKRNRKIDNFQGDGTQVLVATDVAARGWDIEGISHVYNYDIPNDPKSYRHRIGRTARAGEEGKAINLLGENDHQNFRRVMRENNIERAEVPNFDSVPIKWTH